MAAGQFGCITGGWGLSGTTIFQSDTRFTAQTSTPICPVCADTSPTAAACPSAANPAVGYAPGSGDYNADGNNLITRTQSATTSPTDNRGLADRSDPEERLRRSRVRTGGEREIDAVPEPELLRDEYQPLQGHGDHGTSQFPLPIRTLQSLQPGKLRQSGLNSQMETSAPRRPRTSRDSGNSGRICSELMQ